MTIRITCLSLGALLGFAALINALPRWLDRAEIQRGAVGSALGINMVERAGWLTKPAAGRDRVAFLGDSTVMAYPMPDQVPALLDQELDSRKPGLFRVFSLASPGMGALDYYSFAGVVAAARPERVILPVNLQSFSGAWRNHWNRPESLAWIEPRRIVGAVGLPLYWWGVTFDQLLFRTAIVQLGLEQAWNSLQHEQVRMGRAIESLRKGAQLAAGFRGKGMPQLPFGFDDGNHRRFNEARTVALYGVALNGLPEKHPVLRLLSATVRTLSLSGTEVLVYVVPANVDHMKALGVHNQAGLRETMRTLRKALELNGASVFDFHDLFPDRGFRDAGGHFTIEPDFHGPRLLAKQVAEAMIRQMAGKPRSKDL